MDNVESPELIFMSKVHEMTSNADLLIKTYVEALATLKALPEEFELPNREATIELTELTLKTLVEMKVTVTSLTEYSAEMNDAMQTAIDMLKKE